MIRLRWTKKPVASFRPGSIERHHRWILGVTFREIPVCIYMTALQAGKSGRVNDGNNMQVEQEGSTREKHSGYSAQNFPSERRAGCGSAGGRHFSGPGRPRGHSSEQSDSSRSRQFDGNSRLPRRCERQNEWSNRRMICCGNARVEIRRLISAMFPEIGALKTPRQYRFANTAVKFTQSEPNERKPISENRR